MDKGPIDSRRKYFETADSHFEVGLGSAVVCQVVRWRPDDSHIAALG